MMYRESSGGRSGADAELGQDVAHVPVDGSLAQSEQRGDLGFVLPVTISRSTSVSRGLSTAKCAF